MIIKISEIKKIISLSFRIYEEEDEDYPNRGKITKKYNIIYDILKGVTSDKELQTKIYDVIDCGKWYTEDITYRTMCNQLRRLGLTIKEGE